MAVPAALRKGSKAGGGRGGESRSISSFLPPSTGVRAKFRISKTPRKPKPHPGFEAHLSTAERLRAGGGAGFVGNVGRPQGREGWGENGVDDRAVVSILPANLNPPLVPPTSRRKALERSLFTARRACEIEGERTFCSSARVVYLFRRRGWRCDLFVQATGRRIYLLFATARTFLNARFQT